MPDDLKENKGHNVFYCMPLILGLIGLFWQAWYTRKRKVIKNGVETEEILPVGIQQFWVVFFLFFMTGIVIAPETAGTSATAVSKLDAIT